MLETCARLGPRIPWLRASVEEEWALVSRVAER